MSVAVADFNLDGRPDLAVADTTVQGIDIVLNAGDGGFLAPTTPIFGHDCYEIAAGDLDGDGWPDLVVSCYTFGTQLWLNTHDGGFVAGTVLTGPHTLGVTLADINRDGVLDVAIGAEADAVLALSTDGGYATVSISGSSPVMNDCQAVGVADFNNDGWPDLVAPWVYSNSFEPTSVFLSAAGTFGSGSPYGESISHKAPAIADFNADCWMDFAFPDGIFFNNQDGTFSARYLAPAGALVATADVNRDGWPDLLLTGGAVQGIGVLLNAKDGGFAPIASLDTAATNLKWLGIADLNGDGIPDVILVGPQAAQVLYGQCQ